MKKSKHISELSEIDKLVYTDTDISRFVDLYNGFGIELLVEEYPDNSSGKEKYFIIMRENNGTTFSGYYDFYSCIDFDKNGKFLSQGFWE